VTTVAARRAAVVEARDRHAGLSERRACLYVGASISSHRYRSVRAPEEALRGHPVTLTLDRPSLLGRHWFAPCRGAPAY
jgi:hypothetical protein